MAITEEMKNGMKIVDNMDGEKNATEKLNTKVAGIPKDLSYEDAVKTFEMSLDRPPKNVDEVIEFFKNRKLNKAKTIKKTTV
ncbi:hypothetical protein HTVC033P_gp68 [Pelagibacter phage HTVC033P]|jgi:hypothetical protein|nr:hypothetical protein HTVC033P_gp68 [Pelagibacter phage HTVC033P]|tara:strand:- start:47 stop:292 length:246 start_codon:yes stop_codon:yes gene_type:complete